MARKRFQAAREQFPFDGAFDFAYRPATYWPRTPTEKTVLSAVNGTVRRDFAKVALETGQLLAPVDFLLEEQLSDAQRRAWGQAHPAFLGGEFLPPRRAGEVTIVRIDLESTTADVIEVRARWTGTRIVYRVVDEYNEDRFRPGRIWSKQPLSFNDLIILLDHGAVIGNDGIPGGGLVECWRENAYQYDPVPERYVHFSTASSEFYPQLETYYDWRAERWLAQARAEWDETEIDDSIWEGRVA
jgi:hypothetical protein